ncbi:MAG: hypothetical protein ETSY1_17950 [Candidatus Entotheonella factor]|uniref:Uncharacterized protein n=1 Tax=Entotheonella factor TaxID=1429438 RepID=W4LKM9_ENTF1|nr:MAG: hypothetical protein ETSY1_17950 [Candidatus Entotheonella factor]
MCKTFAAGDCEGVQQMYASRFRHWQIGFFISGLSFYLISFLF